MHGLARRPLVIGALILAIVLGLMLASPSASAQDAPPITGFCAVCHGETGPSPFPGVPTIHGLPEVVIENALHNYREKNRPCRTSECSQLGTCPDINMCDIAGPMSDDDMLALAGWYSALPFMPHKDPYDPMIAERGRRLHDVYCEVCHTNLGSDPIDEAGMLRGQRKAYLRTALEDFHQGRRSVGLAAMDNRFKTFAEEDLDALAEFYSGPATYPLSTE
jgi:cytochrome subunit of sulfide dehydrogenase